MKRLLVIGLSAAALNGCGGGGSSSNNTNNQITGKILDGYITGATIFWDCNKNRIRDADEVFSESKTGGVYVINPSPQTGCNLTAYVPATATDADTGTAVLQPYLMYALDSNPSIISPLTTLAVMDASLSQAVASENLKTKFGLTLAIDQDYLSSTTEAHIDSRKFAKISADLLQKSYSTSSGYSDKTVSEIINKINVSKEFVKIAQLNDVIDGVFRIPSDIMDSFLKPFYIDPSLGVKLSQNLSKAEIDYFTQILNDPEISPYIGSGKIDWSQINIEKLRSISAHLESMGLYNDETLLLKNEWKIQRQSESDRFSDKIKDSARAIVLDKASLGALLDIGDDLFKGSYGAVKMAKALPPDYKKFVYKMGMKLGTREKLAKNIESIAKYTDVAKKIKDCGFNIEQFQTTFNGEYISPIEYQKAMQSTANLIGCLGDLYNAQGKHKGVAVLVGFFKAGANPAETEEDQIDRILTLMDTLNIAISLTPSSPFSRFTSGFIDTTSAVLDAYKAGLTINRQAQNATNVAVADLISLSMKQQNIIDKVFFIKSIRASIAGKIIAIDSSFTPTISNVNIKNPIGELIKSWQYPFYSASPTKSLLQSATTVLTKSVAFSTTDEPSDGSWITPIDPTEVILPQQGDYSLDVDNSNSGFAPNDSRWQYKWSTKNDDILLVNNGKTATIEANCKNACNNRLPIAMNMVDPDGNRHYLAVKVYFAPLTTDPITCVSPQVLENGQCVTPTLPPSINSLTIASSTHYVGEAFDVTVNGQNLDPNTSLQITDGVCTRINTSSTSVYFTCSTSYAGNKTIQVMSNGASLYQQGVSVEARTPPPPVIIPVVITLEYSPTVTYGESFDVTVKTDNPFMLAKIQWADGIESPVYALNGKPTTIARLGDIGTRRLTQIGQQGFTVRAYDESNNLLGTTTGSVMVNDVAPSAKISRICKAPLSAGDSCDAVIIATPNIDTVKVTSPDGSVASIPMTSGGDQAHTFTNSTGMKISGSGSDTFRFDLYSNGLLVSTLTQTVTYDSTLPDVKIYSFPESVVQGSVLEVRTEGGSNLETYISIDGTLVESNSAVNHHIDSSKFAIGVHQWSITGYRAGVVATKTATGSFTVTGSQTSPVSLNVAVSPSLPQINETSRFSISGDIGSATKTEWSVIDSASNVIKSITSAVSDFFDYVFTQSGTYSVVAKIKDAVGAVLGQATTSVNIGNTQAIPSPSMVVTLDAQGINAVNGVINGNVSFITGRNGGKAAKFNGVTDPASIRIPNTDKITFGTGVTFDMWVRMDSMTGMNGNSQIVSDGHYVMALLAKSHDNNGTAFTTTASGKSFWNTYNSTWAGSTTCTTNEALQTIPIGEWYRVTYTVSPTTGIQTYINKKLYVNCPDLHPSFDAINSQDLYIGKYSDEWYPLNGAIQDISIYKAALTLSQVAVMP